MAMLELNDLLKNTGFDPKATLVLRHRPKEAPLRKIFPWLAAERPELFDAFQCSHGTTLESALSRASNVASFIGTEAGKALFVGMYRVAGWEDISYKRFLMIPSNKELRQMGMSADDNRQTRRWFDLRSDGALVELKGKLIVNWPGGERSWWRWADRNTIPIQAIAEESKLVGQLPHWTELVLTYEQLRALPESWKTSISQWRGVYLIIDKKDGQRYVGSAHGSENIFGRWRAYARSGHGGNVELRGRDPKNFQFAILERASPDMPHDHVLSLEANWKERLATREFGLNKN